MNLSLCTISLRHQLISIQQIAHWAAANNFSRIELWGIHAKNLISSNINSLGLNHSQDLSPSIEHPCELELPVSMVSDYLPLSGCLDKAVEKTVELCKVSNFWNCSKLRTFAGDKGSADISVGERKQWTERLRQLCEIAMDHGIKLVAETHPNTLTDTLASTLQLLEEVDHCALKINFDVIHVWEAGDNPQTAFMQLQDLIVHMHLKNIEKHSMLDVFKPGNVYAPAGSRDGIVNLFDGAFDFKSFLRFVDKDSKIDLNSLDTSLEWFGNNTLQTLQSDSRAIHDYVTSMHTQTAKMRTSVPA
jgi:3-dehydroshikimate dehydratase